MRTSINFSLSAAGGLFEQAAVAQNKDIQLNAWNGAVKSAPLSIKANFVNNSGQPFSPTTKNRPIYPIRLKNLKVK